MEEEKKEHMQKMKKMELEMEEVFKMKVQEKKQKLRDSEADVRLSSARFLTILKWLVTRMHIAQLITDFVSIYNIRAYMKLKPFP